jgi:hypothetical protein
MRRQPGGHELSRQSNARRGSVVRSLLAIVEFLLPANLVDKLYLKRGDDCFHFHRVVVPLRPMHGDAALTALLRDMGLQLGTVKTPHEAIGGSFARPNMHYLHRAYYLGNSAWPLDVLPRRIPKWKSCQHPKIELGPCARRTNF